MSNGKGTRYNVGGGDDGLDTDEGDDDRTPARTERDERPESSDTNERRQSDEPEDSSGSQTAARGADELPHRIRCDSPKDERDEKTFVLARSDRKRLRELEDVAEDEFEESVYKMDIYLAGLRAGLHSTDEAFLEEMRGIGYGFLDG
ncbi:hypothetical protein EA462_16085 [Natrarchaeobius halalkaliphilus]|uniref:Uncharacterized protein n=1 Tax=Natrarchaeobius halalkaliphilus TaxID=1679091 RepID=A0A3N6LXA9_9EURY|nr:hypothetical protein [Natrarchaeobius halalkaliphilus]RQG86661.1 hypothetical protein EA462_16085 [Natrarchaeobius halalkaliphilus]